MILDVSIKIMEINRTKKNVAMFEFSLDLVVRLEFRAFFDAI